MVYLPNEIQNIIFSFIESRTNKMMKYKINEYLHTSILEDDFREIPAPLQFRFFEWYFWDNLRQNCGKFAPLA